MKRRLMGLLKWANSSHEARLATVLLVVWISLPPLFISTTEPGHAINPNGGVIGVAVQLLFFCTVYVGLLRRSIQAAQARRLARVLALLGLPVNLVLVFDPGSPVVPLALVGLLAGVLAFRYEGVAGGLFLGYVVYLAWETRTGLGIVWGTSSLSLYDILDGVFFFGLPPLGVGTLLLMLWWRARSHSHAGRSIIA